MSHVTSLDCFPKSPHPRVTLDEWLLASAPTTDPIGRVDVRVELTVQGGRYFARVNKSQLFGEGPTLSGGYPVKGRPHVILYEIPKAVVLLRTELRLVLYLATGDADLAHEPTVPGCR